MENSSAEISHHWVEDLFPPTFVFTWEKFIDDLETARNDKKIPTVVSPLDVSAIKNVYQRVYLRNIIEEEERRNLEKEGEDQPVDTSAVREVKDTFIESQLDSSCIWNATEINVLRDVFKNAKRQNAQFKFTIQDLKEQLAGSQERCQELDKLLKTRTHKLNEAIRANERLTIQVDSSGKELQGARERIVNLSKGLTEVKQLRAQEMLDHQDLRVKMEQLRMKHRQLANKMEKMNQEYLHDRSIREEEIKLIYEKEIEFVLGRLEEMTKLFENERDEHARTKNALDHLRNHFFSLSVDAQADIGVSKDEIAHISYK